MAIYIVSNPIYSVLSLTHDFDQIRKNHKIEPTRYINIKMIIFNFYLIDTYELQFYSIYVIMIKVIGRGLG